MSDTTYEEATRCPKCGQPGNVRVKKRAAGVRTRGAMVHLVYCEHTLCAWYNTCWAVQVNPDGTVPPPKDHRGEAKVYVGFENHDREAREIQAMLDRQVQAELRGDGEIRR